MGEYDMKEYIIMGMGIIGIILIVYVSSKRIWNLQEKKRFLRYKIDKIDQLDGISFEKFLGYHLMEKGYKVRYTPMTADYGADLILMAPKNVKIVVQAKRWNSHVGITAVQEILGAIKYYEADYGVVITNNYYTPNAIILAKVNGILLFNRTDLQDYIMVHGKRDLLTVLDDKESDICPLCGSILIERDGKYGKFLGCCAYPDCRYTRAV